MQYSGRDYMPVLSIYLKEICGEMMIKYLHTEQPNTQSEQYLKKNTKYEHVLDKCDICACVPGQDVKNGAPGATGMKRGPGIAMM
jgi:hypothetical protein